MTTSKTVVAVGVFKAEVIRLLFVLSEYLTTLIVVVVVYTTEKSLLSDKITDILNLQLSLKEPIIFPGGMIETWKNNCDDGIQ